MKLLGEEVIFVSKTGFLKRVLRYYKGFLPELKGKYHNGLSGPETVIEVEVYSCRKFNVI